MIEKKAYLYRGIVHTVDEILLAKSASLDMAFSQYNAQLFLSEGHLEDQWYSIYERGGSIYIRFKDGIKIANLGRTFYVRLIAINQVFDDNMSGTLYDRNLLALYTNVNTMRGFGQWL